MKNLFFATLIALLFVGCSNKGAVINGKITGIADTTVYLQKYLTGGKWEKIDSTNAIGGKFSFKIADVYPDILYVTFAGGEGRFPFLLEKGEITVDCDFDKNLNFAGSGTPANDLIAAYEASIDAYAPMFDSINAKYYTAREAKDTAMLDSLSAVYDKLNDQMTEVSNKFVADNKSSIAAAYVISRTSTYGFKVEQVDSLLNMLDITMPTNAFTDKLKERRTILERLSVGKPAPEITMNTAEGVQLSLSSLKGQCVIIDFWASWCGPCRRENPRMVEIYNKYKDQGLTILGVSLDEDRDKWLQAVADDKLTWYHVSDLKRWDCDAARAYGIVAIPHSVLIDKEGNIAANVIFGDQLEAKIQEILGVNSVTEVVTK